MSMTPAELHNRNEIDREILYYVREMQHLAPVRAESVVSFLTVSRRRKMTDREVADRLAYLVSAGLLERKIVWDGGEVEHFQIGALGMDVLDGAVPPRGWKP